VAVEHVEQGRAALDLDLAVLAEGPPGRGGQAVVQQGAGGELGDGGGIGRLERFVGDLLALARLEADDFRLDADGTDLDALVAEAAVTWSARCARHGADFRVKRPGSPLEVVTDGFRVRQLIDGLAENALRVTPAGRPLVLALSPDGGGGAVVQVRDGGPGLTEDDVTVAFERGALTERYRGVRAVGSGLGLAIAHRLTTRLGGTITAGGRAPEGGAAITCPAAGAPGPGREGAGSRARVPPGRRPRSGRAAWGGRTGRRKDRAERSPNGQYSRSAEQARPDSVIAMDLVTEPPGPCGGAR
jgi:signal transduction histidine kinase